MNITLKIEMILVAIFVLALTVKMLKSKNISVKYSVLWLVLPLVFLIFALFSDKMIEVSNILGFELLSNMIFFLTVGILFAICFSLTVIVSNLKKRIVDLTQEISILKSKENKK